MPFAFLARRHLWRPAVARFLAAALVQTAIGVTAGRSEECVAPPGLEHLPATEILIVGEYHGTREIPAVFHDLVCATARNRATDSIVVGLELPKSFNEIFARASTFGVDSAIGQLRTDDFWKFMGDGRHSADMLRLVERLIRLSSTRENLHLVSIGNKGIDADGVAFFSRQLEEHQSTLALVLTGNAHARKQPLPGRVVTPFAQDLVNFGYSVTSLDIRAGGGEAWFCASASNCGPREIFAHEVDQQVAVGLAHCAENCAFDGYLQIPRLSVSKPAQP